MVPFGLNKKEEKKKNITYKTELLRLKSSFDVSGHVELLVTDSNKIKRKLEKDNCL